MKNDNQTNDRNKTSELERKGGKATQQSGYKSNQEESSEEENATSTGAL